jgi:hypothetical protein
MITILQQPLQLNPSNSEHIFNIVSSHTGYTDFRYVVDVYMNPYESYATNVARLKIAPNTYGVGTFDLNNIIYNYITPNIRSEATTNYYRVSGNTWSGSGQFLGTIPLVSGFSQSNAYNQTQPYENLQSFGSYRILIGEQYTLSGQTIVDISTGYTIPQMSITITLDSTTTYYTGNPNRVNVFSAGTNTSLWSPSITGNTPGWTYLETLQDGTFVASGTTTASTGNYVSILEPLQNNFLYIYENISGCGYKFVWNCNTCETSGWNYVEDWCSNEVSPGQFPNPLNVWPGTMDSNNRRLYGENLTTSTTNFQNTEVYRWDLDTDISSLYKYQNGKNKGGNFLTQRGENNTPMTTNGITISGDKITYGFKRRKHHKKCPIVLSFMNGNVGLYANQVSNLVELRQTGSTLNYFTSYPTQFTGTTNTLAYTDPDNKITYFTKWVWGNTDTINLSKVGYYLAKSGTSTNYDVNGQSEILVFDLYGEECVEDPIHFAFVNRNGVIDTITFSQKNIKSLSTKKDVYAQSGIRDSSNYFWGDYKQRNVVYNQDTIVSVEAQSMFVDENDNPIFRDFFMSPYVWLIQGQGDLETNGFTYPYLIPIQITSNSVEEYKSRFNKLFQYDLTFEYNTINQFNNPL